MFIQGRIYIYVLGLYNKLKPYNYLKTEMFTQHLDIQVDIYN
jgi:hypothetical protein